MTPDESLRALAVDDLVLAIHDASFPSRPDEDTGRGTPYSRGARDFLLWARARGFNGVQLGPQGETSIDNPSPYDGTAFTKSILSIALWPLVHDPAWEGILSARTLETIVAGKPAGDRVAYAHAYVEHRRALAEAHANLKPGPLRERFLEWKRTNAWWLERDARYDALAAAHRTDDWRRWTTIDAPVREVFEFGQFVVHAQHAEFLRWAEAEGLTVFGDLQIGLAFSDRWQREPLFLGGYSLGAPPSRTNPEGQPWGYPVFDPRSSDALAFLRARLTKMLSEFHGLRIDHPHGLVCPWVYTADVARGARLFESPDRPDLAPFAIARPDQIDPRALRHADGWVTNLDERQVDAYATRIDLIMKMARGPVLCEVLSTCPYPLSRVMQRYGLGRFRVTQKADPRDPLDVYRTDRAERADWVMLGNHDTPPIACATENWDRTRVDGWRAYLAPRVGAADSMAQAMFADLFTCDAAHVSVFFADLLGYRDTYNRPGVVHPDNWTLRVRGDYRTSRGLDVEAALSTALHTSKRRIAGK